MFLRLQFASIFWMASRRAEWVYQATELDAVYTKLQQTCSFGARTLCGYRAAEQREPCELGSSIVPRQEKKEPPWNQDRNSPSSEYTYSQGLPCASRQFQMDQEFTPREGS